MSSSDFIVSHKQRMDVGISTPSQWINSTYSFFSSGKHNVLVFVKIYKKILTQLFLTKIFVQKLFLFFSLAISLKLFSILDRVCQDHTWTSKEEEGWGYLPRADSVWNPAQIWSDSQIWHFFKHFIWKIYFTKHIGLTSDQINFAVRIWSWYVNKSQI